MKVVCKRPLALSGYAGNKVLHYLTHLWS